MDRTAQNSGITVGELIEQLKVFDPSAELYMSGLQFYRLKRRGEKLVQVEFNQPVKKLADGSWVIDIHDLQ